MKNKNIILPLFITFALMLMPYLAFAEDAPNQEAGVQDQQQAIDENTNSQGSQDNNVADINDIDNQVENEVVEDEDVKPQDLDISKPRILPGGFLYRFKNFGRKLRFALAFNPVKKSELRLKFADERLIEAKELAKKKNKPEIVEKALENYNKEIDKIKENIDKVKDKRSEKVKKFLDKFTDHQIKQRKILDLLSDKAPTPIVNHLNKIKRNLIKSMAEIPLKFDNPDEFSKRLERVMEKQKGSEFRGIRHLQILKELEEKLPDKAKQAIEQVQQNTIKRIQQRLVALDSSSTSSDINATSTGHPGMQIRARIKNMDDKQKARILDKRLKRLQRYIKKSKIDEGLHLKLLDEISNNTGADSNAVKNAINSAVTNAINDVDEKIEKIQSDQEKEKILENVPMRYLRSFRSIKKDAKLLRRVRDRKNKKDKEKIIKQGVKQIIKQGKDIKDKVKKDIERRVKRRVKRGVKFLKDKNKDANNSTDILDNINNANNIDMKNLDVDQSNTLDTR